MVSSSLWILSIFVVGYSGVIFERFLKIHRSAVILLVASLCWLVYLALSTHSLEADLKFLFDRISSAAQIVFFLMGVMTVVELIDSYSGFQILTDCISITSKRKFLWVFSLVTFFLSAVLDNIAATLVMISFMRAFPFSRQEKIILGSMTIIAANAGGAWTPIGDTTTTLLWISGKVTTSATITALFLPSLVSLLVPLLFFTKVFKGKIPKAALPKKLIREPLAVSVLVLGVCGIVLIPVLKELAGFPPCLGALLVLGIFWLLTDWFHRNQKEKDHLKVSHMLTRIDTSGLLFLLGILLAVDSLQVTGLLEGAARHLEGTFHSSTLMGTCAGLLSATLGSLSFVAAAILMYPTQIPVDAPFWQVLAYAAGTGGSIFVISSAAGILWMGLEKIDFITYLRVATVPSLCGFFAGLIVYGLFHGGLFL